MLLSVIVGGVGRPADEPMALDLQPEPSRDAEAAGAPTEGPAEDESADDRPAGLPTEGAVETAALPSEVAEKILDECFRIPSEADPRLSPARGDVQDHFAAWTEGAGVVVWVGTSPDVPHALGSCVAVKIDGEWTLVGRGYRRDPGQGAASIVWHTNGAAGGVAAALTGRVSAEAAQILLTLEDGRRLRQAVEDGVVVIPWTPVVVPVRLVVVDADGQILYDGSPARYS